jgi:hypothetical protein
MAYQKIVVNTGLAAGVLASDTNHIPSLPNVSLVTGTSGPVATGATTGVSTNGLLDANANFTATTAPFPIVNGDVAYNLSNAGNANVTGVAQTLLDLSGNIFQAVVGNENYRVLRSKVLIDTSKDFVALGVQGGDVVYNNTANTQAQVVLVNGSVLILDVDIFGTPTTFDDAYTIFLAGGKGSPTVMQSAECCLLYVGSNTANASMEDATQYVDVRVLTCGDNEVIFKNFKVGEYLPIQIKQLFSTGTSVSARSSCLAIW